jgi:signal transduction histidine kinase
MQMLTNLIDNAIKFNRDGGEVVISLTKGDRDRILVSDTGEGIPSHHLDRLFERFYRVDRARSRELGGTGLGLAIVKHLAKSHGGEVTVRSQIGEGTEFTIELPALDEIPNTQCDSGRRTMKSPIRDSWPSCSKHWRQVFADAKASRRFQQAQPRVGDS